MEPDEIFHISTPEAWAAARAAGEVAPPSLAAEGFVHCSTGAQVPGTIARHFPGATDLLLLKLRRNVLDPELRWEESGHGSYPHLYRPIALAEIEAVVPWEGDGAPSAPQS